MKISEAKKIIARINAAEKYFADDSVPVETKEKYQDKYKELMTKSRQAGIRRSKMNNQFFLMHQDGVTWLDDEIKYSLFELSVIKDYDIAELNFIHNLKKIFSGKIISRKKIFCPDKKNERKKNDKGRN